MRRYRCHDLVAACDATVDALDDASLVRAVERHWATDHGVVLWPEMLRRVRASIVTASANRGGRS